MENYLGMLVLYMYLLMRSEFRAHMIFWARLFELRLQLRASLPYRRVGAAPNGDFGGAAPGHLQEEPEPFLYCFGGATNSSSIALAPRAELSVRSPNKRGLSLSALLVC